MSIHLRYIGAPLDESPNGGRGTDAQVAADAPKTEAVNAIGGFIFGALAGVVATVLIIKPKGKYD